MSCREKKDRIVSLKEAHLKVVALQTDLRDDGGTPGAGVGTFV